MEQLSSGVEEGEECLAIPVLSIQDVKACKKCHKNNTGEGFLPIMPLVKKIQKIHSHSPDMTSFTTLYSSLC